MATSRGAHQWLGWPKGLDRHGFLFGFVIGPHGFPEGFVIDPHGFLDGFLVDPQLQWVEHQKGCPPMAGVAQGVGSGVPGEILVQPQWVENPTENEEAHA